MKAYINNVSRGNNFLLTIFLLAGLWLLNPGAGALHAQLENTNWLGSKSSVEFPFRSINNLIIIPVLLDNMIPLEFLLDTGVRTPILTDRAYSDLLNINYDRTLSLKGAGQGMEVQAHVASNVGMQLPNVQVHNQPMLILEEDYLELSSQMGVPVHGILGYELFSRFVVKIDYTRNMITLYDPNRFKAPKSFERLDMVVENYKPFIHATVTDQKGQKHKLKLLVDTGASHALLLHTGRSEVPFPDKTIMGSLGRGLLGNINGHTGRVPEFDFAGYTFHDVLSSFPEEKSYELNSQEKERDGTLGGELLSRFTVIIDYQHSALYLCRGEGYKRPFIFSKTGLTFAARGLKLDVLEVIEVRKGSPADLAGVKCNDKVYKINGQRMGNVQLADIAKIFRKRDGKKIKMIVLRDGQKVKVDFRLQDLI